MSAVQHPASYRDPAGFVFSQYGLVYRAVLPAYQEAYEHLMNGGLYQKLADKGWIIRHEEAENLQADFPSYKTILPEQMTIWSYPYEWSFSQLKDAALLTLKLAITGLEHGMILKDANAYNIQFAAGKPVLIDSLSFDIYEEGKPWQAFRQFCDHFLNPLLILQSEPDLNPAFFAAYPDGVSPAITIKLLPWRKRMSLNHQLYVYLAASTAGNTKEAKNISISRSRLLQNLQQLKGFISKLHLAPAKSTWNHYYEETILNQEYLRHKEQVVRDMLTAIAPKRVTDIGCNTGVFSMIASEIAQEVIALDNDMRSVDKLYQTAQPNLYPFVADIANPTPALGWMNAERTSLLTRIRADTVMALAVIHHLALSKNIPLSFISRLFAEITEQHLIVEFVPKDDPKAQLLLAGKGDIFPGYSQAHFEAAFQEHFFIEQQTALAFSLRTLYLMRKK